jgi:hypothetical protein
MPLTSAAHSHPNHHATPATTAVQISHRPQPPGWERRLRPAPPWGVEVVIRRTTGGLSYAWTRTATGELSVLPIINGSEDELGLRYRDAFRDLAKRLCADAARKAGPPRYP